MKQNLIAALALLPLTLGHLLLLSVSALLTGIFICFPLAVLISRIKALQWRALTFASIVQTIRVVGTATLATPVGATSLWNLKERTGKHMFNTILP